MKPFPNSAILAKFLATANIQVAIDLLDTMLKTLDTPAVDSDMINTFANFNLAKISTGIYKIAVNTLETQTAIGTLDPVYLRKHPTDRKLQYSNDGTTWLDVGSATGAGDMLKSVYDPSNHGYVDEAAALKDGSGTLDADGIRALIPAAVDTRIQDMTAFFALIRGFLATSASGFLKLPMGIVDAFLTGDANIATGVNYVISPSGTLTQTDNGAEMSVDLAPVYISGMHAPTKATLMLLYNGDVSKFGLAYTWGADWYYVNGSGNGLIRTYSDGTETLNILHRTFDLEGTVAATISPRLYVYEGAGAFSILGVQLMLY